MNVHFGCLNRQDGLCGEIRDGAEASKDFLAGQKNLVAELETDRVKRISG